MKFMAQAQAPSGSNRYTPIKTNNSKNNMFPKKNSRTNNFMNGKQLTKPFKNK